MLKFTDGTYANTERKAWQENVTVAYITYTDDDGNEVTLSYNDYLVSLNYYDEKQDSEDSGFLGKAIYRQVDIEVNNVDGQFNLENKHIKVYIGVKLSDDEIKYIDLGTFVVQELDNTETTDTTTFTAYDLMVTTEIEYVSDVTYPCTYLDIAQSVCDQCGIELGSTSFRNSSVKVTGNPFTNGENCREVLKSLAKISFSIVHINQDDKLYIEFNLKYAYTDENAGFLYENLNQINFSIVDGILYVDMPEALQEILSFELSSEGKLIAYIYDESYELDFTINDDGTLTVAFEDEIDAENMTTDDYVETETNDQTKPITIITLRSSEVESSGMSVRADQDMIDLYGENELVIEEDYFAYTDDLRYELLQNAKGLFGLTYKPITISSIGNIYLQFNDLIRITNTRGETFTTYCFNQVFTYNGVLYNEVSSIAQTDVESEYKYETEAETARKKTAIEIDKANQTITEIVESVTDVESSISQILIQLDSIELSVGIFADLTKTVSGLTSVTIDDAMAGTLLELHIYGNNNYEDVYVDDDDTFIMENIVASALEDSSIFLYYDGINSTILKLESGVTYKIVLTGTDYEEDTTVAIATFPASYNLENLSTAGAALYTNTNYYSRENLTVAEIEALEIVGSDDETYLVISAWNEDINSNSALTPSDFITKNAEKSLQHILVRSEDLYDTTEWTALPVSSTSMNVGYTDITDPSTYTYKFMLLKKSSSSLNAKIIPMENGQEYKILVPQYGRAMIGTFSENPVDLLEALEDGEYTEYSNTGALVTKYYTYGTGWSDNYLEEDTWFTYTGDDDTNKYLVVIPYSASQSGVPAIQIYTYYETTDLLLNSPLRQYGEYYDQYDLVDGVATVTRRVGLDDDGNLYVLDNETTETLGELSIPIMQDTNIVSLVDYIANLSVTYVASNSYTDQFASSYEAYSMIEMLSNSITILTSETVGDDEIIAKLNLAIEDGQGIITITGNQFIVESDYLTINQYGQIEVTGNSGHFYINYDDGNVALKVSPSELCWYLDDTNHDNWFRFSTNYDVSNGLPTIWFYDAYGLKITDRLHDVDMGYWYRYDPSGLNSDLLKYGHQFFLYSDLRVMGNRIGDSVNNTMFIQGYEVSTNASDSRLKENIEDSEESALDLINSIDIRQFDWRTDKGLRQGGEHIKYGFIAQEVQEIEETFVNYNSEEDTYQMELLNIIACQAKAIQELSDKIDKRDEIIKLLAEKLNYTEEIEKLLDT